MANHEHIKKLEEGATAWNAWREENDYCEIDLSHADLIGADLRYMDLSFASFFRCQLQGAKLNSANLAHAELLFAELNDADLDGADLTKADFESAVLLGANLSESVMTGAFFLKAAICGADLTGADLSHAGFQETVLANLDLSTVIGLETCYHYGPSFIDIHTIKRSGSLPIPFLRGVGLSDAMIEYMPSMLDQAIQHYSCFISYSSQDSDFANRLHADLQDKGVRCWFASHDMPIGGKILDTVDAAIRLRDKVLLIVSEHSLKSGWVADEVTKAFDEERRRDQTVLFPIRLDDAVLSTSEAWATKLRRDRHIGDFRRWKEHDEYKKSFERVLRDLTVRKE